METLIILALAAVAVLIYSETGDWAKCKKKWLMGLLAGKPKAQPAVEPKVDSPEPVVETQPQPVEQVVASSAPSAVVEVTKPAVTAPQAQAATQVPQDSVLHRHYLADLQAKKQAITHPYPSDSVLRRHYDALHKVVVEAPVAVAAPVAEPVVEAIAPVVEQPVQQPAQSRAIPEEAVQKRHFLATLQSEIEAAHGNKPSDSVLRRHYDSLVATELQARLAGLDQ